MYYFTSTMATTLRKEKAAKLKLGILDHTLKLIGKKSFTDIYVEDICASIKISKVTFFKYFPQKEDILLYYFRIWCLHRSVELCQKPREGVQGIYFLFDKLCESLDNHPGIIYGLFSYLIDLKRPPKAFPVKPEEKKLLYQEWEGILLLDIQSLEQMLEKFVLESIFKKEITKTGSTRDVSNVMLTLFYGVVISGHLTQQNNMRFYFRKSLEMIYKGLS
jgi:AcrR family transcriptional regulator